MVYKITFNTTIKPCCLLKAIQKYNQMPKASANTFNIQYYKIGAIVFDGITRISIYFNFRLTKKQYNIFLNILQNEVIYSNFPQNNISNVKFIQLDKKTIYKYYLE
jgi:hypothetical protein